jgi:hypothetical protein
MRVLVDRRLPLCVVFWHRLPVVLVVSAQIHEPSICDSGTTFAAYLTICDSGTTFAACLSVNVVVQIPLTDRKYGVTKGKYFCLVFVHRQGERREDDGKHIGIPSRAVCLSVSLPSFSVRPSSLNLDSVNQRVSVSLPSFSACLPSLILESARTPWPNFP